MCCIIKWIHLKNLKLCNIVGCCSARYTFFFSNLNSHWKRLCTVCMTGRYCLCQGDIRVQKGKLKNSFKYIILSFYRGYAVASSSDDRLNEPPTSLGLVPHQVRDTHKLTPVHLYVLYRGYSVLFAYPCPPASLLICACVYSYPLSMY